MASNKLRSLRSLLQAGGLFTIARAHHSQFRLSTLLMHPFATAASHQLLDLASLLPAPATVPNKLSSLTTLTSFTALPQELAARTAERIGSAAHAPSSSSSSSMPQPRGAEASRRAGAAQPGVADSHRQRPARLLRVEDAALAEPAYIAVQRQPPPGDPTLHPFSAKAFYVGTVSAEALLDEGASHAHAEFAICS